MEYISTKEASAKWGISERRIQKLCEENRISGVVRFSRVWEISRDAEKLDDARCKLKGKNILLRSDLNNSQTFS